MKNISLLLILSLLWLQPLSAQFLSADIQVSGLTCSLCSRSTELAIRELDFVKDIDVDLNRAVFVVSFYPDKEIDMDKIPEQVEAAGFSVSGLTARYVLSQPLKAVPNQPLELSGRYYHVMADASQTFQNEVLLTFIDKHYVSNKTFRTYQKNNAPPCYRTGFAVPGECPHQVPANTRIYHITL
ncbi:MAG: heavy metal-associated domain-containing protein [Bacteroidota bacterium]